MPARVPHERRSDHIGGQVGTCRSRWQREECLTERARCPRVYRHRRSEAALRAFTLLEMMVVVAILGVFFALAVPVLTPEVHKAQLDGASDVVASFVARARSQAMESKRCTRVFLNTKIGRASWRGR